MKKVFLIEENDVEELIKNSNIVQSILYNVLNEDKVDQKIKERLVAAESSIKIVNDILSKND